MKLTELTMPLSARKPSLTGNTWSFVSAISSSCRESQKKSVNKNYCRFNAAILFTEHCLCLHIMGRRRRSRWHDCGKHFAQPVKKKKKKNTAAQTETQHCLLFFRAHNVVTVSQNNSNKVKVV